VAPCAPGDLTALGSSPRSLGCMCRMRLPLPRPSSPPSLLPRTLCRCVDACGALVLRGARVTLRPRDCPTQTGIEAMFESMAGQTLKDIRRYLPVSGRKMEWNVAAHRMTRTLRK
jgi:hypothetical protein